MKLVLKKNHEMNGILYLEGAEIEVTAEEYQYILDAYMAERKELLKEEITERIEHFKFKKGSK